MTITLMLYAQYRVMNPEVLQAQFLIFRLVPTPSFPPTQLYVNLQSKVF